MRSSFCGRIDEFPLIRVDNFESPEEDVRAYFLSHCHCDHTQGLYSNKLLNILETRKTCIYMSESSAAIVEHTAFDKRLVEYIRPLSLGSKLITLPGDEDSDAEYIEVTVVPAGHCFGSVMFIFKNTTKTVMYTGDFRLSAGTVTREQAFHDSKGAPLVLDALYVDTTFNEDRYQTFPTRKESIDLILSEIKAHLAKKNGRVALHTSAGFGYEHVFNEVYKKLGRKVYVKNKEWSFYSKVKHLVPGVTNDKNNMEIHLCRQPSENYSHDFCLDSDGRNIFSNKISEQGDLREEDYVYLYIHFSAMIWDKFEQDDLTFRIVSERRVNMCFATHCSKDELTFFVNYFPTSKIVGFPVPFVDVARPLTELTSTLDIANRTVANKRKKLATPKKEIVDQVKIKKVPQDLMKKMFEL